MNNAQDNNMNVWPFYNMATMGMYQTNTMPVMYNPMMNYGMYQMPCQMMPSCPMMNYMSMPYMNNMAGGMMCPMMEADIEEGKAPYVTMKAVKIQEIQE